MGKWIRFAATTQGLPTTSLDESKYEEWAKRIEGAGKIFPVFGRAGIAVGVRAVGARFGDVCLFLSKRCFRGSSRREVALQRDVLSHCLISLGPSQVGLGHSACDTIWVAERIHRIFLWVRSSVGSVQQIMIASHSTACGWLMLAGIFVSIALCSRVARQPNFGIATCSSG